MKIYVSNYYHKNRDKNFLRNEYYISTLDKRFFPSVIYLNNLYKYHIYTIIRRCLLHQDDIYFPNTIIVKEHYYEINGFQISFLSVKKEKISEILTLTEDIFSTGEKLVPVSPDDFKFFEQTEIENSLTSNQFIQESYFLYDKSNVIKKWYNRAK